MAVEYYKARTGYYYRKGPRGAKRVTKEEYEEAVHGKPQRRSASRSKHHSKHHSKKHTKPRSKSRSKSKSKRSKSHSRR